MRSAEEQGLGWGNALAPPGSVEHAKRWRLDMQAAVDDMDRCPDFIEALKETGDKWRVWTLLKGKDGSPFASWSEFCEEERPYGLGTPAKHIDSVLELKVGHNAYQRLTVAPDRRAFNGANQHTGPREETGHGGPNPLSDREAKRLRAINRAPEAVRELYDAGLIGQKEAARLGPKNPTPEEAAEVVRVADAAVEEAKRHKPKTDAERKKVQRKVNEVVRGRMTAPAALPDDSSVTAVEMPNKTTQLYTSKAVADAVKINIDGGRVLRGSLCDADWQMYLRQHEKMVGVREYGTKED